MRKINVDENGNKLLLKKLKNMNLTYIFSLDEKYDMFIHSIDTRGKGIKNLYSYLKGLDEKKIRYIVVSDLPIDYFCRTFDKEIIDNIHLVKEILFDERIFCLNGRLIKVEKEVLENFDKTEYEEFYKSYVRLEKIPSECLCDCIQLKKLDDNNVYIIKSGCMVLVPQKLLVTNILYIILSLQRFYGAKRYFEGISNENSWSWSYFCSGHGERKDLYVKSWFAHDLFKLIGRFYYPYGEYR